ncbi:ion transporter [Coprobacter tertius]|uniref:Ion transporter n=1 Tax=Coprobacter tertius TaxID=2944915 RepID=A0ABT1MI53_9BACT|nr:ion transporter [Coprobacter tertius]MCP9610896.1 ion transporter [Coprobacter tertius]
MKIYFPSLPPKPELKKILYTVIFKTDTPAGKNFDIALLVTIVFSVLLAMLESVRSLQNFRNLFRILEWIITVLFTIEYVLRIYCSPNKRKYIFSFYGIIDLLAILPSFLGILFSTTRYLSIVRSLRLLRIFRIFKLSHFVKESDHLADSLKRSFSKILLFSYFIIIMVTILGSIMYMVEGNVNPSFSNIPESIYWAIVTITTVGYGDITPITFTGQLISSMVMLLGYSIIAVPSGIFTAEMIRPLRKKNIICDNCGNKEHDKDAKYCKQCGASLPDTKNKQKT